MATKIVWRTDAEYFDPGQVMRSRGEHASTLDAAHIATESLLREKMENGEETRSQSLYTWRDETWARHTWKMSSERSKFLYKLKVDETDIRHAADLCYYTEIGKALADNATPDDAIEAYVAGTKFIPKRHFKPRVEVLVAKATVVERYDPLSK